MLQMFSISWDQLLKGEKCTISVGPIQKNQKNNLPSQVWEELAEGTPLVKKE